MPRFKLKTFQIFSRFLIFFQFEKDDNMVKAFNTHYHTLEQRNAGSALHLDVDAHSHESPQQTLRETHHIQTLFMTLFEWKNYSQ